MSQVSSPLPRRIPDVQRPADQPVAVIGPHAAADSSGWVARSEAARWRRQGIEPLLVDVSALFGTGDAMGPRIINGTDADLKAARTVIVALHPHQMRYVFTAISGIAWDRVHLGATFVWDLEEVPQDWRPILALFDRLVVPSTFVRESVRASGLTMPIDTVPYDLSVPADMVVTRQAYQLPEHTTLFLLMFNYRSGIARKNVLAAIDAFAAVAADRDDIALVIKSHASEAVPTEHRRVRDRIANNPNIIEVDQELTDAQAWGLIATVDCVLSPHRSEGYGLTLMQGLMLDRWVIGTDWSGPTDFLHGAKVIRLPYRLVPVEDPTGMYGMYQDLRWAEPDLDAVKAAITKVADACAGHRS